MNLSTIETVMVVVVGVQVLINLSLVVILFMHSRELARHDERFKGQPDHEDLGDVQAELAGLKGAVIGLNAQVAHITEMLRFMQHHLTGRNAP